MGELISDVQWFVEDEENLVNALAGDEDEAYSFKMAFSDLAAELQQFEEDLEEQWIPECFDDLFPAAGADFFGGFLGYDSYEHDYFGLEPFQYKWAEQEAEKRICRMTKKELLEAVGACLKVYTAYIALQYRYDCLEASLKIIQEKNLEGLKLVKAIEEQYDIAELESNHFQYMFEKTLESWTPCWIRFRRVLAVKGNNHGIHNRRSEANSVQGIPAGANRKLDT